jgi:hypothetical protein
MTKRKVTPAQISKIHVLLSQLKLMHVKADLVNVFTDKRETSTKEMTMDEAIALIRHLSQYDTCDRMRKKVFALAYEAGIIWGDTPEDKKINAVKLNMFLAEKGTVKKEINRMSSDELVKVVSQFEQIIKHMREAGASKAVKTLLASLGIKTETLAESKRR